MEILVPKYRRDPNAKVESLYQGVSRSGGTVTAVRMPSADGNRMETTRVYGPGIPRGQGGRVGVLVLGGMETSLDEMQDILEMKQRKPFVPRRTPREITDMCRALLDRRNDAIMAARKQAKANPSEVQRKRTVRLHLPVGYRLVPTSEPGFMIRDRRK